MSRPTSALDALAGLAASLDEAIRKSPASDLERNLRTQFISELAKRGLVTREEYEVQVALLEKTRARLAELEKKIAAYEARAGGRE
jgi:ubiquinone biosynthesis accessory factor UbiK